MKYLSLITLVLSMGFLFGQSAPEDLKSIYDSEIAIKSLQGDAIDLKEFKGKKVLFVNVASKCGFTPQYEGLEKLYQDNKDKLVIIGVPCNQFGSQEPGTASDIESFCRANYGVSFLMTEKVEVKGDGQHALYSWLTDKTKNGKTSTTVKWNFQKYLIDEDGKLMDYFYSTTKPSSKKIAELIAK